ncbi:Cellular morphogenesis protein (Bud22) [Penicillium hetheringtonii]|uniref:Cellular morphogenesis protein (Bud22) n=1 Tax=Penicillium hetheringtonii TaxID=911720 RepID=A0AAD6DWR6_9EURO|nr:Cellular morphogenesis protein (Bud22) [Penicillium hetheringtonii]
MPKRKLGELDGPQRSGDKAGKMSMKAVRLGVKFDQGVQIITKGLKTARGFERQKLSRREKTARSDNNRITLIKLGEEIEALKALDYHVTAERYLFKQLSKTKRIAESPTFKEFQESKNVSTEGPKSTAEANILARLFKSNPVKNVMPNILAEIRKLLGVDEAPTGKSGMKEAPGKEKTKERKTEPRSDSESESEAQIKEVAKKPSKAAEQESQLEDVSGSEDGEFDSDELEQFNSRLAPGSDAEDESESEDADESGGLRTDDISDSVKGAKAPAEPVKETTFLPSLMMGGYWSGSEEASDDEAAGPPKRKNRMGQQARRALWEEEKAQQQQKKNRDSGWDMKRGATDGGRSGRGGRGGFGGRSQNRYDDRSGSGSGFSGGHGGKPKGPPKDEGPLHPSWEAKRKQKEQTTAAFQGKKVTFD